MPFLYYDESSKPTREEFQKAVHEMFDKFDPVEDLLHSQRRLIEYEQKYGVSSEECYRLFYEGKMGDDPDMFAWVAHYRGWLGLKTAISDALYKVAITPQTA